MTGKRRKSLSLQQYSSKAEAIATNVDLLTEILVRLPTVSVLRFKCVAKQWRSIISDPKFATNHTRLNAAPTISGLFLGCYLRISSVTPVSLGSNIKLPTLSFLDILAPYVCFVDSCNGLFLCVLVEESGAKRTYVVCNPTTQCYKVLPVAPVFLYSAKLAYFPSKALYKVILIHGLSVAGCKFQIYSSDTASWKEVHASLGEFNFKKSPYQTETVYWDEAVHWMYGESTETVHYRFDVNEEKLEAIQLPPQPKMLCCRQIKYFGECGGRLFLIQTREEMATGFRILEMGKGCTGWSIKFRLNLRSVFLNTEFTPTISDISVLGFKMEAKEDEVEIVIATVKKVVLYNLKSDKVKVLYSLPSRLRHLYNCGLQFQASLATL